MYQGKHVNNGNRKKTAPVRRRRRRVRRGRRLAVLACIVILLGVIGGLVAYLVTNSRPAKHSAPSEIAINIEEEVAGNTWKNIQIRNVGDTDAYIRAAIAIRWEDDQGNPVDDNPEYTLDVNGADWFEKGGVYYHKAKVGANGATAVLVYSCAPSGDVPDGYRLVVDVFAEAIQAGSAKSVESAWSVTVGSDGMIS